MSLFYRKITIFVDKYTKMEYMKNMFFASLAAIMVAAFTSCKTDDNSQVDGWKLVWEENFESETIDEAVWGYTQRGSADWAKTQSDDVRCYAFRNGNLVLRGIVNDDLDADPSAYLCGGLCTKGKKEFKPGSRIEVRAKLQAARGAWPAIWLLPYNNEAKWPNCGEIDIMERLNHDGFVYQTVHSHYTHTLKKDKEPANTDTINIAVDDFNVYGVDIFRDSIVFHVNGIKNHVYPRIAELPDSLEQFPYFQSYYLLVDMQLEGKWVGKVDPAELPVEMEIDWVKYYIKEQ